MMIRNLTLLLVVLALFLAGCAGNAPAAPQGPAATQPVAPAGTDLADTKWKLVDMGGPAATMPALGDANVTLEFADGRVGGNSGCNTYGGGYELANGQIKFGEMLSTMMACDEDRMLVESSYLAALQSAARIELAQDVLTIYFGDPAAGARLVFNRQ